MASAAVSGRRRSAYTERLAAKRRRQKILVGVGLVVLAALLAYEVPHTLKLLRGSSSPVAAASSAAPSAAEPKQVRSKLPSGGGDPFAAAALPDGDPRVAAAGGPDPFTAPVAATAASTPVSAPSPSVLAPAAPKQLPKRIVIGRPGGDRVATHGWIVILASIPTAEGRSGAERFAHGARANVGRLSILNSSNRSSLRGGYWVVYAGPYRTLTAVSHQAGAVHASGYRTAYIRELVTYR